MVLRSDNQGEGVAEYYSWQDGSLLPSSTIRISITMAELSQQGRIVSGMLRDECLRCSSPALQKTLRPSQIF